MTQTQGRLEGKVALVTGASPNIGGTAAAGFAAQGALVACNDVNPGVAEQTAAAIRDKGGEAIAVPADVTDPQAVAQMVAAVRDLPMHRFLPVLVLSCKHPSEFDPQRRQGVTGWLVKPIEPENLRRWIRRVLPRS